MNAKLLAKIQEDCTEIDVDALYDAMIEELYGDTLREIPIFSHLDAGKLHRETDETAARCGTNDYVDSLCKDGEIDSPDNGNTYYRVEDMDTARDELLREIEQEATELRAELTALENEDGANYQVANSDEAHEWGRLSARIEALELEETEIRDCALNA